MANTTKKKSNFRRWVLALNRPIIGVIWLIVSIIFRLLAVVGDGGTSAGMAGGSLIDVIKTFINRILGLLSLFGIPGTIVGIVMLVKNRK